MAMLASLFSNSTAADTRRLVEEREAILADNTGSVDDVARAAEQLSECYKALESANATVLEILASPEKERLTEEQIAEMLRKLTCVMTTDLPKLSQDLQILRKNKAVLKELVQKMRELKGRCETALSRLNDVTVMNARDVVNLTTLRGKAVQADLQSTFLDGSGFV